MGCCYVGKALRILHITFFLSPAQAAFILWAGFTGAPMAINSMFQARACSMVLWCYGAVACFRNDVFPRRPPAPCTHTHTHTQRFLFRCFMPLVPVSPQHHSLTHWAIDAGYSLAGITTMVCVRLVVRA